MRERDPHQYEMAGEINRQALRELRDSLEAQAVEGKPQAAELLSNLKVAIIGGRRMYRLVAFKILKYLTDEGVEAAFYDARKGRLVEAAASRNLGGTLFVFTSTPHTSWQQIVNQPEAKWVMVDTAITNPGRFLGEVCAQYQKKYG